MPLTLKAPRGRSAPWRSLLAFAALLVVLFALSLGAGRLVGPLSFGPGHGGSMPGMPSMPGMTMNGLGAPAPASAPAWVPGVAR